jgi:hypothetical protein
VRRLARAPQRPANSSGSAPLPGLAASAAQRLPRWAFFLLLILYVGHGLFFRDPWRGDDLINIALAKSTAQAFIAGDFSPLLLPQLHGLPWTEYGPLWTAISALFVLPAYANSALFDSPVSLKLLDDLARVPLAITLALGLIAIWRAIDRFARRREAQPIDPLGVGPNSKDFGRTLADCGLLITVATLGVIYPWHQSGIAAVSFLLQSLLLWALSTAPETPRRAAGQIALIMTAMLLVAGPGLALANMIAVALIFLWVRPYRLASQQFLGRWVLLLVLMIGTWVVVSSALTPTGHASRWWTAQLGDWQIQRALDNPFELDLFRSWAKEILWKWWPLWPIVIYGLWKHRRVRLTLAPHWAAPIIMAATLIVFGLIGPKQWQLHELLPVAPLALIAAFSLLTLPRPLVNLIDWFAVTLFTALGLLVWLYWLAFHFGVPQTLSERIDIVAPGLEASFRWHEALIGLAATIAWLALVIWRIGRGSPRLWRPVVISAGGLTLIWVLLMTLWLSAVDRIQGQGTLARSLSASWIESARQIKDGTAESCVQISGDLRALDAIATVHTALPLSTRNDCRWRLGVMTAAAEVATLSGRMSINDPTEWRIIWRSSVREDRRYRDRFVLMERNDPRP